MLNELLKKRSRTGETTNGAQMYCGTDDLFADLYLALVPGCTYKNIKPIFEKCFSEDPEKATSILLQYRDIEKGKGRRDVLTDILFDFYMDEKYAKVSDKIAELGSYRDIFKLINRIELKDGETYWGNPVYQKWFEPVVMAFKRDRERLLLGHETGFTLVSKWLPMIKRTPETRKFLHDVLVSIRLGVAELMEEEYKKSGVSCYITYSLNERKYRAMVKALRSKLNVTETHMTNIEYEKIDYSKIPSVCRFKNQKAFRRIDSERWNAFGDSLSKGEVKINTNIIYPADVFSGTDGNVRDYGVKDYNFISGVWKNIMEKSEFELDAIPILDCSGSMDSRLEYVENGVTKYGKLTTFDVAFPISLYVSRKNTSRFKGFCYIFSNKAKMVEFDTDDIFSSLNKVKYNDNMTTNLASVFQDFLTTIVTNKVPQEELPKYFLLVSDCQINKVQFCDSRVNGAMCGPSLKVNDDTLDIVAGEFKKHGYEMPKLIIWYVGNPNNDSYRYPVYESDNLLYIVGHNTSMLNNIKDGKFPSVLNTIQDIFENDRWRVNFN